MMSPASLGQTLLVLSLATLALSQKYFITPNNQSSCNTTCYTLDQLAQTDLTKGANLTLIFQPGEHTLTRLLSVLNFAHVQMIGQNTPVLTLHDRGWIKLSDIDQLRIESMTFTGHTMSDNLISQRLCISNIRSALIHTCSFTGLFVNRSIRNPVKAVFQEVLEDTTGTVINIKRTRFVSIENSTFTENKGWLGGAVYIDSWRAKVIINNCSFSSNTAGKDGGAIYVATHARLTINNSTFTANTAAKYGGAIFVVSAGEVPIINLGILKQNSAENDQYSAGRTISVASGGIFINRSILKRNNARYGGGIYVDSGGKASISHSTLVDNISNSGGIHVFLGSAFVTQSTLTDSTPNNGPAIHSIASSLLIIGTKIVNNSANTNSMYISQSTLTFSGENTISKNNGPIYALNSQVHFNGPTLLENNHGTFGGAIRAFQSAVYFNRAPTISNNIASKYGGGVFLRESSLFVNSPVTISHNTANEGGGIYAYQSTIEFNNTGRRGNTITNNIAKNSGGGIHATASIIKMFDSFVYVDSNIAKANGGGLYLQQNSRLYFQRRKRGLIVVLTITEEAILTLVNNKALLGGGVYINDRTSGGGVCNSQATEAGFLGECFIQATVTTNAKNTLIINITQNTADQSGSAIYGGLLDRCTMRKTENLPNRFSNGLEYIRETAVGLPADEYSISSDPLQVELCDGSAVNVFARKGQPLRLRVKALDQAGRPVNATIRGSVVTKSRVGRLKEGQVEQRVGSECTELEYNVFSEDISAQVELYAIGPCSNLGISKLTITVMFFNCTCPLGFHPSQSNIECSCECEPELQAIECFPEEETFQPDSKLWIGAANFTDCNITGYLVHNCPFDYCLDQPVNISLNSSQWVDRQCAFNRSGVLCGECEEGFSLLLATSKCKECSNLYLLLLILFAVAGIVLVAFILCLNITVATGTLYGLILYANVLAANKATFLPFPAPNFLTVFVAWVNLDLGIETCFYDGMSSQAKVLLQLAFPAYLFLLIFLIIILSRYSNSFATLLSNRNPVAALCSLLILTYSKLLRMIIATLQFTSLKCPDDSASIVWLYNANVPYFSPSHIPRFVAAAIILTACVLFTTLLFFGQWFPRCSKWKVMKWTKNTKYIGFIDAFHAPFTPKHRYWPGLLLFALIVHNLVASMTPNTLLPVLSAGCIAVGLNVYKSVMNHVYKSRLNNALENIFLLNVAILALGTTTTKNNNRDRQRELAYVSMAIAFMLFLAIMFYHFYKYVLKKTNVLNKKQLQPLKRKNDNLKLQKPKKNVVIELQEVAEVYSYEQRPREETNPDKYITPPIIRPATKPDQLREPYLDILAPITKEDYRQAPPAIEAENRPRPVVTSTVVEIS